MMCITSIIPVISLFFCGTLPFSSAEYPPPTLPSPLTMEKYQVDNGGDLSCPSDVNLEALQGARQIALAKYSNLKEARNFEEFDAGMREIWDVEDESIKVIVPAAGTYVGIESVIEYIALVVGSLNYGFAFYYNSIISDLEYFPTNSSYAFQVAQKAQFYCSALPSPDGSDLGNCETGEIDSLALHHITWKPCSSRISQYVIDYDNLQDYLAIKGASPESVCSRHERWCTGENKQYESFFDCMEFMESIPSVSCGSEKFNGDNMVCRFKHSFMLQFRPEKHCSHVGKESYVCDDAACEGDFERACEATPGDMYYTDVLKPSCSKKCTRRVTAKSGKSDKRRKINTSRCANSWY